MGADKTIVELNSIDSISEADTLPIWDESLTESNTKKVPVGQLFDSFVSDLFDYKVTGEGSDIESFSLRLPNGITFQWGKRILASTLRQGSLKINLERPFKVGTTYGLSITPQSDTAHYTASIGVSNKNETGFTLEWYGRSASDVYRRFTWMAIGYTE